MSIFQEIERITRRRYKKTYKFYKNMLSNFSTVLKDTNRNLITATQCDYNCISYALGVYDDWLAIDAFAHSTFEDGVDLEEMNHIFHECCVELEMEYAARRLTGPEAELAANERMIAFRIGGDDFHFARRNSDGVWTHKPGANYIREMSEEELFGECWSEHRQYPYISEVAFFAVAA